MDKHMTMVPSRTLVANNRAQWRVVEKPHFKETQIVLFLNGHETGKVATKASWAKHGRQGAWQHCARILESNNQAG